MLTIDKYKPKTGAHEGYHNIFKFVYPRNEGYGLFLERGAVCPF